MPSERFPRSRRLRGEGTFRSQFRQGRLVRSGWLSLIGLANGESTTRFGCVVRRKTAPSGVVRNRLKRWLREAFRRNQETLPVGWDLLAMVVRNPSELTFRTVEETFLDLVQRLSQ